MSANPKEKKILEMFRNAPEKAKESGWYSLSDYIKDMKVTEIKVYQGDGIELYTKDGYLGEAVRSNKKSCPLTPESIKEIYWRINNETNYLFLATMTKTHPDMSFPTQQEWDEQLKNLSIEFLNEEMKK